MLLLYVCSCRLAAASSRVKSLRIVDSSFSFWRMGATASASFLSSSCEDTTTWRQRMQGHVRGANHGERTLDCFSSLPICSRASTCVCSSASLSLSSWRRLERSSSWPWIVADSVWSTLAVFCWSERIWSVAALIVRLPR